MFRTMSILAICVLSNGAAAQTVYKCSVDGKVAYGDTPCATGKTIELSVPAAPATSPDTGKELERQKALLARIEKERLAHAAREQRGQARDGHAAAARKQRCDKLRLQQKWAEEDLRKAAGPATEPLKLKVRRQAEALAVECPG
jgi:Rad3-related DNA helicase